MFIFTNKEWFSTYFSSIHSTDQQSLPNYLVIIVCKQKTSHILISHIKTYQKKPLIGSTATEKCECRENPNPMQQEISDGRKQDVFTWVWVLMVLHEQNKVV